MSDLDCARHENSHVGILEMQERLRQQAQEQLDLQYGFTVKELVQKTARTARHLRRRPAAGGGDKGQGE